MERQLRAGGGIMTLEEPRQGYFLGRLVKKAKRAVKKVVKSPIGKAALLAGGAYFAGGGGLPQFLGGKGLGGFGSNAFGQGITSLFSKGKGLFDKGNLLSGLVRNPETGKFSLGRAALTGLGAASIAAPFLMGGDDEEVEDTSFTETPDSISDIVNMAKNQDSSLRFLPKPKFVDNFYLADGGLANVETPKRGMVDGPGSYAGLKNIFVTPSPGDSERMPPGKFDFMTETGPMTDRAKEILSNMSEEDIKELQEKGTLFDFIENIIKAPFIIRGGDMEFKAYGGRIGKAEGGIMDLGGLEKDYREGGFVPLGEEERADDVPARLSKNEFVFTADAVRNAGGGDIDKGAEVMQNMMDNLEAGGTISEESQGMENPAQEMFDQSQMLESRIA